MIEEDATIPDTEACKAAEWLSKNAPNSFDTPTFWLVAGLLANYLNQQTKKEKEKQ